MTVYAILEGRVMYYQDHGMPTLNDARICETGFSSEIEAVESLKAAGWDLASNYGEWPILPNGAWRNYDADGRPTNGLVRFVRTVEVDK